MFLLVLCSLLVILLTVWYYKHVYLFNWRLRRFPSPPRHFLLGHALYFLNPKGVLPVLLDFVHKYGDIVRFDIGPVSHLVACDYKLLELILTNTRNLKKSPPYRFLSRWLGTGLLTNEGNLKWKKHRKILTPAFHFKVLEDYLEVFGSVGKRLIKRLEEEIDKDSVDINRLIALYSLDVICETTMGTSVHALEDEDSEYVRCVKQMCRIIIDRSFSFPKNFEFLYKLSRDYRKEIKTLKFLHGYAENVIRSKMRTLDESFSDNSQTANDLGIKNKKSFLDLLLLEMKNHSLSLEDIRHEVETFMFAGHDTTSSGISFLIYNIAKHPDIQEKVHQEQKNIFRDDCERPINMQDLREMKYLELVIKESLRLYPPVPFYARELSEDLRFGDDIFPKGLIFIILPYAIHRNPKYFPDPEKFNPERFDDIYGDFPYAYIPFSSGPRNCIGQKFAMNELKTVISELVRKFQFLPTDPPQELDVRAEIVLISGEGIKVRVKKR